MDKYYISTTLPYVNDRPHLGHVLEFVQADVLARYHRLLGDDVVFNVGTDEHGIKVYRKAVEQKKSPQDFVDEYSEYFRDLKKQFNISFTNFIRTTDPDHIKAAQEFWKICQKNGDIYKKSYKIKYCVGCELEKTASEIKNGHCKLHPDFNLDELDEENYFFRFSKYLKKLLELYDHSPDFVVPANRLGEIKKFVEQGLNDFSISRLKSKTPWGIPVPDDDDQVMYVWFDALINYISTLGWPNNKSRFEEFWGTENNRNAVQIAGKDNLRQQSAIWQAMLLSAGLPPSKQIFIHGFVTLGGQKMSKSTGNVIDPVKIAKKYGIDATRYYLLREIPSDEDGDFSVEKLEARYNGDLANGLGNLVQRVAKLIENNLNGELIFKKKLLDLFIRENPQAEDFFNTKGYDDFINNFRLHEALGTHIGARVGIANKFVDELKPWSSGKNDPNKFLKDIIFLTALIHHLAYLQLPFLPETSKKIIDIFGDAADREIPDGYHFIIKPHEPLFPRLK